MPLNATSVHVEKKHSTAKAISVAPFPGPALCPAPHSPECGSAPAACPAQQFWRLQGEQSQNGTVSSRTTAYCRCPERQHSIASAAGWQGRQPACWLRLRSMPPLASTTSSQPHPGAQCWCITITQVPSLSTHPGPQCLSHTTQLHSNTSAGHGSRWQFAAAPLTPSLSTHPKLQCRPPAEPALQMPPPPWGAAAPAALVSPGGGPCRRQ